VSGGGDVLAEVRPSAPAVVLKLDRNVMHHGGLGVIRSLGRLGVPVYGVHEGPFAPAASSRFLHGRYFWNPGADDAARIRDGLLRLGDRIGEPAVLFATDDAGAIFLAEHGEVLRSQFLFPDPPADLPRRLAGKYSLYQLCRELEVPTPHVVMADSEITIRQFAADAGFPLVAKLSEPWRGHGRLRSTIIVADSAALSEIWAVCGQAGVGLMLQEFIPAGAQSDWFFHGYCDSRSGCWPAFTGIKERSYPARAGLTSLGCSAVNPRLRKQVCRLLAAVDYRGIVDVDVRRDARDGELKVLDVNPRLGAQFRLLQDTAGIDVAIAQYLDLTGQEVPHGEQAYGRRLLVENYDPAAAISNWRSGELGVRAWAASLRGIDETAWFARDDLLPFGLMCVRMGARFVSRPFARREPRAPATAGLARFSEGRAARARPVADNRVPGDPALSDPVVGDPVVGDPVVGETVAAETVAAETVQGKERVGA
jgi:D-aspartate ligase